MKGNPTLKEECDSRTCGYQPGTPETRCMRPVAMHYLWDVDTMENGFACVEHIPVVEQNYSYDLKHAPSDDCGELGAIWWWDENVCMFPFGVDDVLATAELQFHR